MASQTSEAPVRPRVTPPDASPVQQASATVGAVFGLLTLLSCLPGFTVNLSTISIFGLHPSALLLGLFSVSLLHNLVRLAVAVAGFRFARTSRSARRFLLIAGTAYVVLAGYGFLVPERGGPDVIPIIRADDWLHLVLGFGLVILGLLPGRRERRAHSS